MSEEIKECCSDIYEQDWVRTLLGESYHPGGTDLTERIASHLALSADSHLLDIASGRGTSAVHMAKGNPGCITGVDLSEDLCSVARRTARTEGLADRLNFIRADSEDLPFGDSTFEAALCECAFCTFPDKEKASREIVRVLKPGGRLGLSDITVNGDLPEELDGVLGWIACVADALPQEGYEEVFRSLGMTIKVSESHSKALRQMIVGVQDRFAALNLVTELDGVEMPDFDLGRARELIQVALDAVDEGVLGYTLIIAEKPA